MASAKRGKPASIRKGGKPWQLKFIFAANQNGNRYAYGSTNEMEQCKLNCGGSGKHLRRNGYEVKRAPKGQDMTQSIRESNVMGRSAASCHPHQCGAGGSGPLVMVYSKAPGNLKYAQPVYDVANPFRTKKGVRRAGWCTEMTAGNYMPAELSGTNAVAVYCECEFHDQEPLAKWIVANVDGLGAFIGEGNLQGGQPNLSAGKTVGAESVPDGLPRAGRRLLRKSKCGCPGKAPETGRIQTDCEGGYAEILTIFCARP